MDETRPPVAAKPWYVTPALARTLDALARLAHTGAFIGAVKGPPGAGKSLLLERLDALLAGDEHLAVARVDAGTTPGLLGGLANAFGLATDGNPTQTRRALIRHLTELHGAGRCPVTLIDDAQRLSSIDLSLLIRLGLSADKGKSGLLNVILAGTGELDQRIAAAGEDLSRQRVYVAVLPPLTIDESLDFLARHVDPLPARLQGAAGRRAIARAGGLPGALLALLDERRRPARRLPLALASAGVLAAAIGAVLYQNRPEPAPAPPVAPHPVAFAPAGVPSSPASAPTPGLPAPTAAPARIGAADEPAVAPTVADEHAAPLPATDPPPGDRADAAALPTADRAPPVPSVPPAVPEATATSAGGTPASATIPPASTAAPVAASDLPQPLPPPAPAEVAPDAGTLAGPSGLPAAAGTDAPERAAPPPAATGVESAATGRTGRDGASPDPAATDAALAPPPATGSAATVDDDAGPAADTGRRAGPATAPPARVATPTPKPPVAPAPARGRPAPADGPLARAPESAWVVQLAATESEARLRAYAARNGIDDIVIVRTRRDGRDWYVLLLGGLHASRDAAEAALAHLPGSLRVETAPWVRSVRSLRKLAPPRT